MSRFARCLRLLVLVISKDWWHYCWILLIPAFGLTVTFSDPSAHGPAKYSGLVLLPVAYAYLLATILFVAPHRDESMDLLMSLPAEPFELNLARFASLYSLLVAGFALGGVVSKPMGHGLQDACFCIACSILVSTMIGGAATWTISLFAALTPLSLPFAWFWFTKDDRTVAHLLEYWLNRLCDVYPGRMEIAMIVISWILAVYSSWAHQQRESRGYRFSI